MVKIFTPSLYSEPGSEELAKEHVRFWSALPKDTILSFFLDSEDHDKARQAVPDLAIPSLVMHGTEDYRVPYETGVEVARRLPNSIFYTFQDKGHVIMETAPGEFCQVLRHFVRTGEVPQPEDIRK